MFTRYISSHSGPDFQFFSCQLDTSQNSKNTDTEIVHYEVCLFSSQLLAISVILIVNRGNKVQLTCLRFLCSVTRAVSGISANANTSPSYTLHHATPFCDEVYNKICTTISAKIQKLSWLVTTDSESLQSEIYSYEH